MGEDELKAVVEKLVKVVEDGMETQQKHIENLAAQIQTDREAIGATAALAVRLNNSLCSLCEQLGIRLTDALEPRNTPVN